MSRPKQVTPPSKKRKAIVARVYRDRADDESFGSVMVHRDPSAYTNGELLDAAIDAIKVARKHQQIRHPEWANPNDDRPDTAASPFSAFSSKARRQAQKRRRFGPIVLSGGSHSGYMIDPHYRTQEGLNNEVYTDGTPQTELFRAASLILAELERMQYVDELAVGYVDKAKKNGRRNQEWQDELSPLGNTAGTAGSALVWTNPSTSTNATATATLSPLILSTGDVRGVP